MKTPSAAIAVATLVTLLPLRGQTTTPTPAAAAAASRDEPVQLSVFEVSASDEHGYAASTALSGTRTNEKLENLPNSISVMTSDLLSDLGALNFLDAADYAVGAENIYNDGATRGAAVGTRSGNQISFRGLPSVRQLRDGFPWYMPQDVFNTERIEFSRGPGGLSYGDVDAGGTVNVGTKRALLGRSAFSLATRWDSWGGRRVSFDDQQTLVHDQLAVRLNALYNDGEGARERSGTHMQGVALAVRWKLSPRTLVDVTVERVNDREGATHAVLTDDSTAYVRGTGTIALDANPAVAGVQANGVGTAQTSAATSNVSVFTLIGDRVYNLKSTATQTFRYSRINNGAGAAALQENPLRIPRLSAPETTVPRYQDWGGPMNFASLHWRALTAEVRHDFSRNLNLLVGVNQQVDRNVRPKTLNDGLQGSFGGRGIFLDVNPQVIDVTDPANQRLVPNPYYEKYYIQHQLLTTNDGHDIRNVRAVLVYDVPQLPWGITQRVVLSTGFRFEKYYKDIFNEMLSPEEVARRGLTGAAAQLPNNLVYRNHYLVDGNQDGPLSNHPITGLATGFYRRNLLGTNARYDQNLANSAVNLLGSTFKERLHTSIGFSRDRWHQKIARLGTNSTTGLIQFVDANGALLPEGAPIPVFDVNEQWTTNQSYGAVLRVLPWLSLTGAWLESKQFSDNVGTDLNGRPFPGLGGKGIDAGARLNFLDGRITLSYVRFNTVGTNVAVGVNTGATAELAPYNAQPFNGAQDFRDRKTLGHEVEAFFSPTPQITARISYASSYVTFTNFYPLLSARYAEAVATAKARGRDPTTLFPLTEQFFADADPSGTRRHTVTFTGRYSFTEGVLRGFAVGAAARYQQGHSIAGISVGGIEVIPDKYTDDMYVFSPFASYRHKFSRVTWTGQVNVQNIFDRVSYQGNNYRNNRLTDPRQVVATNTFLF